MPDISVLTITYENAFFIGRCYYSLLCQTNKNWEWVIVDDGSTDNTKAIIEKINDPRIKYHQLTVNGGRGKARNLAFEFVTADWVAVLDMDDMMDPTRLEWALKSKADGFDFMVSSTCLIDNEYNITGFRDVFYNKNLKLFTHATICGKVDIFRDIKYSNSRNSEDQRIILLVTEQYKGQYIEQPLYIYHENASLNLEGAIKTNLAAFNVVSNILFKERSRPISFAMVKYNISFLLKYIVLNIFKVSPKLYNYTYSLRSRLSEQRLPNKDALALFLTDVKLRYPFKPFNSK